MKLLINGRGYDPAAQPFIGDLRLIRQAFGFGWGEVAARLGGLSEDADMSALLDDDECVDALVAWIWMARLRAGERDVTVDDVRMTPLDGIIWIAEPGDDAPVEADDPVPSRARTDSAPGGAKPDAATEGEGAVSSAASTTRSTRPSTVA